jgi:hypothetical protein
MVTRAYMLAKKPKPSRAMRFVHWHATPVAINALASAEDGLEQFRAIGRTSPAAALALAFAIGTFLAHRTRRP